MEFWVRAALFPIVGSVALTVSVWLWRRAKQGAEGAKAYAFDEPKQPTPESVQRWVDALDFLDGKRKPKPKMPSRAASFWMAVRKLLRGGKQEGQQ